MRKLLSALILSFSIWSVFSCRQENNVTVKQYPMFWTWLDYRPGMNFDFKVDVRQRRRAVARIRESNVV